MRNRTCKFFFFCGAGHAKSSEDGIRLGVILGYRTSDVRIEPPKLEDSAAHSRGALCTLRYVFSSQVPSLSAPVAHRPSSSSSRSRRDLTALLCLLASLSFCLIVLSFCLIVLSFSLSSLCSLRMICSGDSIACGGDQGGSKSFEKFASGDYA